MSENNLKHINIDKFFNINDLSFGIKILPNGIYLHCMSNDKKRIISFDECVKCNKCKDNCYVKKVVENYKLNKTTVTLMELINGGVLMIGKYGINYFASKNVFINQTSPFFIGDVSNFIMYRDFA